jgi:hypothetical protein
MLVAYPDRAYVLIEVLAMAEGRVLNVGVGAANEGDWSVVPDPELFFTIDVDPETATWGAGSQHVVADFLTWTSPQPFDHIVMFGVLGCPDSDGSGIYVGSTSTGQALAAAARNLAVGGRLALGVRLDNRGPAERRRSRRLWLKALRRERALQTLFRIDSVTESRTDLMLVATRRAR